MADENVVKKHPTLSAVVKKHPTLSADTGEAEALMREHEERGNHQTARVLRELLSDRWYLMTYQMVVLQRTAFVTAIDKGWWDDQIKESTCAEVVRGIEPRSLVERVVAEKIALIHSEVSEALEDFRVGAMETRLDENGKPCGFPTEMADVVIRVMDLCGALGIDLQKEVVEKMIFNEGRPHRHGGKRC